MASRIVKLLKVDRHRRKGTVLLTGGLALDEGLLAALQEEMVNEKIDVRRRSAIRIRSMPARSARRCGARSGDERRQELQGAAGA